MRVRMIEWHSEGVSDAEALGNGDEGSVSVQICLDGACRRSSARRRSPGNVPAPTPRSSFLCKVGRAGPVGRGAVRRCGVQHSATTMMRSSSAKAMLSDFFGFTATP